MNTRNAAILAAPPSFIPHRDSEDVCWIGVGLTASVVNPKAFSCGYDRLRFVEPVMIGDTIRTRATITAKEAIPSGRAPAL